MVNEMNVALIGKGYWGSKIKKYIDENIDLKLKYVCDSKTDLSKVWKDDSVKAVFIATPNGTHFDICFDAISNNKAIWVEKPLTLSLTTANTLASHAREHNLPVYTDYVWTYSRSLNHLKTILKNAKIKGIKFESQQLGRFGGGDVYWLLGSHMLSILSMFTDISKLRFHRNDIVVDKEGRIEIPETGAIYFSGKVKGEIFVSLNSLLKSTRVTFYLDRVTIAFTPFESPSISIIGYERKHWTNEGLLTKKDSYSFGEDDNLGLAVDAFYDRTNNKFKDNLDLSVNIVKILEGIHHD